MPLSIQNEPDFKASYEGCEWTATEMTDFLKTYGQLITSIKVIASESYNNNQAYVNTILVMTCISQS